MWPQRELFIIFNECSIPIMWLIGDRDGDLENMASF